jgi:beta,beta-carotene 9',10'-dioxygenase
MADSPHSLGFTTLASETSIDALPVRGTLPAWLAGRLVRTGPARFEVGDSRYNHWFDGLAILHAFVFAQGRVSYRNRYLRSQAYEDAIAAGTIRRREFATDPCRTIFERVASWFSPKLTDNGCVNVIELGGAVVALTETRLPVRFDPDTLATLGVREYSRDIHGPVSTAHPHLDFVRRRHNSYVLDFGRRSTYRFFGIGQETGRQSVIATISVDRPAYVHSFGMSEHHLILVEPPLVVDPLRLRFGSKPFICNYRWKADRELRFHVVDKTSGRVTRTASCEAAFAFHHVKAFEVGGDVFVDLVTYPDASIIDRLYLDTLRSNNPGTLSGSLTRFRIGTSQRAARETLSDTGLELPRFNYRRRAGRAYRYAYGVGQGETRGFLDSLVKLDLERGTASKWREEGCYPGEPVFVEAPGTSNEDAGVILSVVLDGRAAASYLLVLDASTFAERARAEVPHHIPFGFHGNYTARTSSS